MRIRTYSELRQLSTFEERVAYLKLGGAITERTFGGERYLNQRFYASYEWKKVRNEVIARDLGLDLGVEGYPIFEGILVHHMNPILPSDISDFNPAIIDSRFLITTSLETHNYIHYGVEDLAPRVPITREPGDTLLW